VDLRRHSSLVEHVLRHYGLPPSTVELADDVALWCKEHGLEERNPYRAARCFPLNSPFLIVLRAEQSEDMINSAKARMELDGLAHQVRQLDTDTKYLVHLLLHEIAALKLCTGEQLARDNWAFNEFPKHVPFLPEQSAA
jgi:hypothetical protein